MRFFSLLFRISVLTWIFGVKVWTLTCWSVSWKKDPISFSHSSVLLNCTKGWLRTTQNNILLLIHLWSLTLIFDHIIISSVILYLKEKLILIFTEVFLEYKIISRHMNRNVMNVRERVTQSAHNTTRLLARSIICIVWPSSHHTITLWAPT